MKLAIISHTEHYKDHDRNIVGWGPTITEINHLAKDFEKIYHVAFFHSEEAPPSSLAYTAANIEFVPLPPSGGRDFRSKMTVLTNLPQTISVVREVLNKVDVFQFRAPVGIGVYLIPYLTLFSSKKGWFKYAGNWSQEHPPLGYKIQRHFLQRQKRKVTINGKWPDQPKQCLTFENPCLTLAERAEGLEIVRQKQYVPKFTFCFVGRLEDEKGVQRILDAFTQNVYTYFVNEIHLIGNGPKREDYEVQVREKNIPVQFHGFLSRNEVFAIYKRSHFLLLPSTASEGFPKVIAEAMNYGCIPVVSQISSIGQYIHTSNGYLVHPPTADILKQILNHIFREENEQGLSEKAHKSYEVAKDFTFEHYRKRIQLEIIPHDKKD